MILLPEYLMNLDVGSHEVFHDNEEFHVLVKEDSQYRYLFEINQSDFERMELMIIGFILIAMFFSWGGLHALYDSQTSNKEKLKFI